MDQADWERVASVLDAAQSVAVHAREAFVQNACGNDESTCRETLRLLALQDQVKRRDEATRDPAAPKHVAGSEDQTLLKTPGTGDMEQLRVSFPTTGDVVAKRYTLKQELGRGAFGTVYEAHDRIDDVDVAVKFVALTSERQSKRYDRELATLRRARVPGIVKLLDDGRHEGWAFLVMNLVEGSRFPGSDLDRYDPETLLPRVLSFMEALRRLHLAGVVHRDLKPSNVLVDEHGQVTIVDLGIAEDESDPDKYREYAVIIGTPLYMSPERMAGAVADTASDIYAAGMTILTAIRRLRRGQGDTDPVTEMLESIKLLKELPDGIGDVLGSMVRADANRRPDSMDTVVRELQRALGVEHTLELPFLGPRDIIQAVVDAVPAGRSINVYGRPGSGRTRTLQEAANELSNSGVSTRWHAPGSAIGALNSATALFVDDFDRLDPREQERLAQSSGFACLVTSTVAPQGSNSKECHYLSEDDIRPLIKSSNRFFFTQDELSEVLWKHSRGRPKTILHEIERWIAAGLATWDDGLYVDPRAQRRIVSSPPAYVPTLGERVENLSADARDVWAFLTLAGTGLNPSDIETFVSMSKEHVRSAICELKGISAVDLDRERKAWIAVPCPDLASVDSETKNRWCRAIATLLPLDSIEAPLLYMAMGDTHALVQSAKVAAQRRILTGEYGTAFSLINLALCEQRKHSRVQTPQIWPELVEASLGLTTIRSLDVAMYHLELATNTSSSLNFWKHLIRHARATFQEQSVERQYSLDDVPGDKSIKQTELFLTVSNLSARRGDSIDQQRETIASAVRYARRGPNPALRYRIAAWTGWLRFHEGRYQSAVGLHRRAARRAISDRGRVTALCNAAIAATEAAELGTADSLVNEAFVLASKRRDHANIPRIERLLRVVKYRRNVESCEDKELVRAANLLDRDLLRGAILLNEAAILWRAGRNARASNHCQTAAECFRRAAGSLALQNIALALLLVCQRRSPADMNLVRKRVLEHWSDHPPGIASQTAALMCVAQEHEHLHPGIIQRANTWAHAAQHKHTRREVLTPSEVLSMLPPYR